MKQTNTTNEKEITKLNDKIKNNLRIASIFYVLSLVGNVLSTIIALILIVVEPQLDSRTAWNYLGYVLIYFFSFLLFNLSNLVSINRLRNKYEICYLYDKGTYLWLLLSPLGIVLLAGIDGLITGDNYMYAFNNGAGVGSTGLIFGYIFILVSYCFVVKKYKIVYADDIRKNKEIHKQLVAQQAAEKQREKELSATNTLLSKVGNKFFVKYYFELRDWSEPDILDVIQEDYSEDTKLQRIQKGKEIFNKKLNKLALQRIADSENKTVDEETRQKANELLGQIK